MDLRKLEQFVTVADARSFDKAASWLFLSQSAVSQQVKRLEVELGASLIDRRTRPFTLTAVGEDVYAIAKSILRQVDSIRDVAEDAVGDVWGHIRIGVTPSLLFSFVPERINEIQTLLQNVKIELIRDYTSRLHAELHHGAIDVVLSNTKPDLNNCLNQLMWEDQLVLAYKNDHPPKLSRNGEVSIDELNRIPLLTFKRAAAPGNHDRMVGYFSTHNVSPRLVEVSGSYVELLGFVRAGVGSAIVTQSILDVLSLKGVGYADLAPRLPSVPLYLSWIRNDQRLLLKQVIDLLADTSQIKNQLPKNLHRASRDELDGHSPFCPD